MEVLDEFIEPYYVWADKVKAQPMYDALLKRNPIAARHLTSLGGTAASVVLHKNPWMTARDLYLQMTTSPAELLLEEQNLAMRIGSVMEEVIRNWYHENISPLRDGVTLTDISRPWSSAQVDALRIMDGVGVEIKTAGSNRRRRDGSREWGKGNVYNDKGECTTVDSQIPEHYFYQIQKQMYLLDTSLTDVVVMFRDTCEVRVFTVKRDDEVIQKILNAEDNFIFNNLVKGVEPVETYAELEQMDIIVNGEMEVRDDACITDMAMLKAVAALRKAKAKAKENSDLAAKLSAHITSRLQHAGATKLLTLKGSELAHITASKRTTFRTKDFKADHPDLYAEYSKEITAKPTLYISE